MMSDGVSTGSGSDRVVSYPMIDTPSLPLRVLTSMRHDRPRIDELVYKLYELTPEEIATVEGTGSSPTVRGSDSTHGRCVIRQTRGVPRHDLPAAVALHPNVRNAQCALNLGSFEGGPRGHAIARHDGIAEGAHF